MRKYYFPINRQSIALLGTGIILNIMCFSIATAYSIPFFLDAVGVFFVAILMGPIAGAITGLFANVVFGIGAIVYSIPAIAMSFIVGWRLYRCERIDAFRVVGTGFLAGIATAILALPTNMIFNGGMTGNLWGDAFADLLSEYMEAPAFCCLSGSLLVNIPDKVFTLGLIMAVITILRRYGVTMEFRSEDSEDSGDNNENGGNEPGNIHKKKKLFGRFFVLFLVASLCIGSAPIASTFAEEDSGSIDFIAEYAQTEFGVEKGLNSAEINAIAQSGDGYIWAGAYSGLYRYDGTVFEQMSLDENITNATTLHTDRKGRLWIGTNDSGVACYDPYSDKLCFITVDDGLCSNSIRDIGEDDAGNIYVATATYLARISFRSSQKNLTAEGFVPARDSFGNVNIKTVFGDLKLRVYDDIDEVTYAYSITSAGEGKVCGITESGKLFMIEDDKLTALQVCGEEGTMYSCGCAMASNAFAVGTSNGKLEYFTFLDGSFIKTGETQVHGSGGINTVNFSADLGGYFIGCDNGYGFVDLEGKYQDFAVGAFDSAVSDILVDKQGNIWFASSKDGISKFSYNPFKDIFRKSGIEERVVNAIYIDGVTLYVGTDTGVLKLDRFSGRPIQEDALSSLDGKRVRHIMKDSRGALWISTYSADGVVRISRDGEVKCFNRENSDILGSKFRFVHELSDGRMLIASTEGFTYMVGDNIVLTVGSDEGLEVPKILSLAEDADGTLWIGTDGGGVYRMENDKVVAHYGKDEGLQSEVVMKIVQCTEGGRIYVASNGLYYHEEGADGAIRKLTHFPYTNNYDVYITEDGRAFISSSAGLFAVNENELVEDDHDYSYALLNRYRGLTTTLTANAWNAAYGSQIYLCCTDGVRILSMADYENFDSHYQIVLRSISKDGKEVKSSNGVYNIPAGSGQIRILPAILNYTVSDPLIHVQLEGVDDEGFTTRQSELGEIYYPSIPYGTHNLRIQVLSDSSDQVKKEMVFAIHKEAKLYEHTYYKIYLAVNLSLILLFFAWFVAKMGNMAVINRQYDEIKEAKEEAELANNAKSKFLAQMSHEIRTPINAVLGMDEMILRESREPEIRGYAADIYTAGQTLLSLINDILDSSKIDSGKMEIVPVEYELSTLIRDLVNMISQRAQAKDLNLTVEVDPDLPKKLFGDDVRVRQVITNILTNAVKYTETGTVWLRVGGRREGDRLSMHVEVEDTGMGIKEEDLPKLFEAYQRIEEGKNRKIEGTGLGITITVQLLKLMGSELKVHSIYGKGSKFYFDVYQGIVDSTAMGPFDATSSRSSEFEIDDSAFTAPDANILVVDDNAMNRKVFRSLLKRSMARVDEADSGKAAIAKVEQTHYDIIFMDHMMPEMDGVETMKHIREEKLCDDTPIYVLTANAVTGAKEEYLALGFDGYLAKPVAAGKLEEALRETLPDELKHPLTAEERAELESAAAGGAGSGAGSQSAMPDLPDVEGLDWSYAFLHLPSEEMLKDGVESFYGIIELQSEKLQEFYEGLAGSSADASRRDSFLDEYRIQVHGMKSAAATIGIVPLAGIAKMLEFAAKDGNIGTIEAMHDTFVKEWKSYSEKLRGVFGLGTAENAAPGDTAMLETMFEMLVPAMEDLDVDTADEIMEKMKQYTFGGEIDALVGKLNGAVKNLDEDETKAVIEEIKALF